jgi:flagellar basal-body rod modification protein FlgD
MSSAVDLIGKDVRAEGNTLSIKDGEVSALYYALGETAANTYINIYDPNGNLVRTVELGGKQAGEHEFQWDGLDWAGEELPDGIYGIGLAAEGVNGDSVMSYTEVSGEVAGVQAWGGQHYLRLADGRVVNYQQISEVVDPSAAPEPEEEQ